MIQLRSDSQEIKFVTSHFPDGTSQVWQMSPKENELNYNKINFIWEGNEAEILHLLQLIDLIRSYNPKAHIYLDMPYLPYGRQDKLISNNATFALETFARLLNSKEINLVTSFDVHSSIANELINNFVSIDPMEFHDWAIRKFEADIIFYPDKGAASRYRNYEGKTVYGEKIRNQLTGAIEGYKVVNEETIDLFGKRVIIVDDICDGGATFIEAAKALHEFGVKEVGLCVSHGIFSKGFEPLMKAGINDFYMTNSLFKNEQGYKVYE